MRWTAAALLFLSACTAAPDPSSGIVEAGFRKHIEFLASDAMRGRNNNSPEGRKAAEYVADRMKELGLEPAGTDGYFHEFSLRIGGRDVKGVNVAGILRGASDEIIVINAHHDGLGARGDRVYNGADDNASGVAMILVLAEAFKAIQDTLPRSLVFVSFDAEEDGLVGSRAFVDEGVVDADRMVANICFDLIGGDFFPWEGNRIYALGSECSEEMTGLLSKHIASEKDLNVERSSISVIEPLPGMARSDYANFRKKDIPFIFFSTATPWYYHTLYDDVDKINWPKIQKAGRFVFRFIRDLVSAGKPTYRKPAPVHRNDLVLMRDAMKRVQDLDLGQKTKEKAAGYEKDLAGFLENDDLSKNAARKVQRCMILLFSVAKKQKPKQ